jgi:primosomal protein N' (replication factor Y)
VVDLRTKAKADPDLQLQPPGELPRTELIHNPPAPPAGSLISPKLETALRQRLDRGEQAIIFLNRRGYSSSIQCTECGLIEGCPRCSVALTFHRQAQRLRCHLCDHDAPVPNACPSCGHFPHKYSGTGTEKVEHALKQLFPDASIGRMDADTMRARGAYTHFLREFADGKIDFLVGTQMIAKGLHFPNVTCVGVVNSDMALLIPDFRAGERVFQLLMQVSGRSGRGQLPGEVFVQTRVPFHPSIQFARHNDYSGFAESEMDQRQATGYPPFSRLIMVTGKGRSEEKVSFVMDQIAKELNDLQLPQTEIIGPNPAPLAKVEDRFRYQIFLRTTRITTINTKLRPVFLGRIWMDEIQVSVNVDPTDLQ